MKSSHSPYVFIQLWLSGLSFSTTVHHETRHYRNYISITECTRIRMPRVSWIIQQLIYNREELHSTLASCDKTDALKYVTTTCILLAVFLHDSWHDTNTFVNECAFSQWGKQSLCERFYTIFYVLVVRWGLIPWLFGFKYCRHTSCGLQMSMGTEVLGNKRVIVALCPPQISKCIILS